MLNQQQQTKSGEIFPLNFFSQVISIIDLKKNLFFFLHEKKTFLITLLAVIKKIYKQLCEIWKQVCQIFIIITFFFLNNC